MNKLIKSQVDESQMNENEIENLYGGSGGCIVKFTCVCDDKWGFADEDDQENVVF